MGPIEDRPEPLTHKASQKRIGRESACPIGRCTETVARRSVAGVQPRVARALAAESYVCSALARECRTEARLSASGSSEMWDFTTRLGRVRTCGLPRALEALRRPCARSLPPDAKTAHPSAVRIQFRPATMRRSPPGQARGAWRPRRVPVEEGCPWAHLPQRASCRLTELRLAGAARDAQS